MSRVADLVAAVTFRAVARTVFRIRVLGRENIPARGPALLVSNHLTHLDGFLIGSCLEPVVRFLVWKPYYDSRLLNWGFRIGRAIPVWTRPHSGAESIRRARAELARGEVLCIFAEGSISRTGELLPFQRGLEAIVRSLDVPIVPVHLGGLWESIFSYRGGRFLGKRPRPWRHPVAVCFGRPMQACSTAPEVREAVKRLAETAVLRIPQSGRQSATPF